MEQHSFEQRFNRFDRYGKNEDGQTDHEHEADDFFESTLENSKDHSKKQNFKTDYSDYLERSSINRHNEDEEDIEEIENFRPVQKVQEIKTPTKRKPKAVAKVKYLGLLQWKGLSFKEMFIKASWIFCALMFLKMIFMDQGVIDFVRMENVLDGRKSVLRELNSENDNLMKEINLIKNNVAYQKKLVRDQLGAISSDEHLILFQNDTLEMSN